MMVDYDNYNLMITIIYIGKKLKNICIVSIFIYKI